MDTSLKGRESAPMSAAEPGMALEYIRVLVDFLADEGLDMDRILRAHGVDPQALASPDFVVPYALFESFAAEVITEVNEPALGIRVGEHMATSTHGSLGIAAVSSASTRQLLELIERFLSTRITVLSLRVRVSRGRARAVLHELVPMGVARALVLEVVLLSIKNVLMDASMGRCPIAEVRFPFPRPAHATQAEESFGCPVVYGARHAALDIPSAALDEPLKLADPRTRELASSLCEREVEKLGTSRSYDIRARKLMLEHAQGFPSMTQLARRLHLTPRTLARKFTAEGTSYRHILDDLRHRMAVDLINSGSKMDEVAYLLGYTDTSNFRRAFHRWAGEAPSKLRE